MNGTRTAAPDAASNELTPRQHAFADAIADVLINAAQAVAAMPAEDFTPGADLPTRVREHVRRRADARARRNR